jgi:hypothetical protein
LLFQLKGKTPEPLTTANFNYTFRDKGWDENKIKLLSTMNQTSGFTPISFLFLKSSLHMFMFTNWYLENNPPCLSTTTNLGNTSVPQGNPQKTKIRISTTFLFPKVPYFLSHIKITSH